MIKYFIFGAVIIVIFFIGWQFIQNQKFRPQNQPAINQQSQKERQDESSGRYGFKEPFYDKEGISLQHYWPGDGSFSNEETEILLFNDSNSNLQVKSFDLAYSVEGKTYPHKSGTWEKFPSKTSWDRIEHLNISAQYYKGELLSLTPGQKGKLHWHIQFGEKTLDGKQTVQVRLTLFKGNETIAIDKEFKRDSRAVFSKDDH